MHKDTYTVEKKLADGEWEIILSTDDYDYAREQLAVYDRIYAYSDDVVCVVMKRHIHF